MGYRTCYYRTFNVGRATPAQRTAYKKAREWMDRVIDLLKPGMSTDKVAAKLPKAQEAGFASEMDAFGLNFRHGLRRGNLLPGHRRHLRGAHRRRGHPHPDRR